MRSLLASLLAVSFAFACGADPALDRQFTEASAEATASGVQGSLPAGLPAHFGVGLAEQNGQTWMKSSGVAWDYRYMYLTKGWSNNWGFGALDGSFARGYMNDAAAGGFVPVLTYYQMNGETGGSEGQFLAKAQNAATMKGYFSDFKLLMQQAKAFGKPVVVHVEPDGFGFLEQQSSANPNAPAAVASTGLPELAGLPNTVAGWGLAFLQLRKAAGAGNVILAIHLSSWATGVEFSTGSVTAPLQPIVDQAYAFLSPLGLTANATGGTWDLLVGDPLDRDADYYVTTQGRNPWWDASDGASISTASFNRYAEWLRLWNLEAGKRWLLWQIPVGNSNHLDVFNNGAVRQGYKDNRAEYFFAGGPAHAQKFAAVGVVGLLFGSGASGQSSYQNDTWTDGQLFLKSRVASFKAAGGVALPVAGSAASDAGTPANDAGTPPPDAGTPPADAGTPTPPAPPADAAQYGFESGDQGWISGGAPITGASSGSAQNFAGTHSLAVTINGAAGAQTVKVSSPPVPAGRLVTFHVFVPAASQLSSVQPYVLQGAAGGWTWTGNWQAVTSLKAGAWNTLTVQVPPNAAALAELGVQLSTKAAWTGTAYVDAVSW